MGQTDASTSKNICSENPKTEPMSLSIEFVHDSTLFVIDIHQNMLISLFDHLRQRLGVLIVRDKATMMMMASRHLAFAPPDVDGDED